jgi:DNA-binding NarL/FixJ family response regulator
MVVEGLLQLLIRLEGIESCAAASSVEDATRVIQQQRFDLFLVDMNLPDGSGADLIAQLKKSNSEARIIAISGNINPSILARLKTQGADAVFDKGDSAQALKALVQQVIGGGEPTPSSRASVIADRSETFKLSKRQQEVLLFLNEGLTNKEISYRQELSQATVAFHIAELKKKLGCDNTREIPSAARKLGILL